MRWAISLYIATAFGLASGPLPQRAYIWQRQWSPALRTAVLQHAQQFSGLDVLCAEVSYSTSGEAWIAIQPDLHLLAQTHLPVGLVFRVGTLPGTASRRDAAEATIISRCQTGIREGLAAGIRDLELQLDCDVPTRLLPAYAGFVARLQQSVMPTPLYFTALPSWLDSPSFAALAAISRGYILQVHSLQRPEHLGEAVTLCDPQLAEAWIKRASRVGRDFRVALPTYGYRLGYDPSGNFLALQADGFAPSWPDNTQVRTILADPAGLAGLIAQLTRNSPAHCLGVEWFRFPLEEKDTLAWRWETLAVVMAGATPVTRIGLQTVTDQRGLYELYIANSGTAPARVNILRIHWDQARFLAADGIDDWQIKFRGGRIATLEYPGVDWPLLQPGEKKQVGWLRLDQPAALAGEAPAS